MLALVRRFPSLGKRAQLLNDARYGNTDDDQPRDRKTEKHDGRYRLAEQRQAAPCDARADIASARGKLIG